ncbi:hypothetical protein [Sphingomonas changbaiensis]|nr:hypothetical protein [Sphingomonas changbaiensis]
MGKKKSRWSWLSSMLDDPKVQAALAELVAAGIGALAAALAENRTVRREAGKLADKGKAAITGDPPSA